MKVKKMSFMLILLLIVSLLSTRAYAENSTFSLNLKADNTAYNKGDTLSVAIDLANVSDSTGIIGYQAKIVYDANVLTLNSFTSDNWEVMENEGRNSC